MDKFPLVWEERVVGELTAEREALYTWFSARCRCPEEGIWCAWAVGDRGELRLGVLEPCGEQAAIRRRFSRQMTAPLGKLLRGEIRPAGAPPENWDPAERPERLFRAAWLQQLLQGAEGALTRTEEGWRYVALPYDAKKRFPMETLFCFARIRQIRGKPYAVFHFDGEEQPVMEPQHF